LSHRPIASAEQEVVSMQTKGQERLRFRRRPRAFTSGGAIAVALVASAVLAAGCGGGSAEPGVASVAATTSTTSQSSSQSSGSKNSNSNQTFSACMRSHGVQNFPDANSKGGIMIDSKSGINPDSPQFQAAQKACQKLAPNGGKGPSPEQQAKMQSQMLKFSACMRSHGLPDFPDPKFSSGGRTELKIGSKGGGLNPHSPIFQAAQKACQKLTPGLPGGGGTTQTAGGPNAPASGTATGTSGK
jgi:hypothetical protein